MPSRRSTPRLLVAALLLSFGLSVPAFSQSCTNLCLQQTICPGGSTTTLTGYVFDPANDLPVPNAIVYIPNAPVQPFVDGPGGGSPITGSPLVAATTDLNGAFTLTNMPAGSNIPLVVQLGLWRRKFTVPTVVSCSANSVSNGAFGSHLTLPANHSQGDIPRIAIVTGAASSPECTLTKMGVSTAEFADPAIVSGHPTSANRINLYEGESDGGAIVSASTPTESALTESQSVLNSYDVLMLPCQGQVDAATQGAPAGYPNSLTNALNFVNAGGRLFAEHFSYAWLKGNGSLDSTALWSPGAGTWGSYYSDPSYNANIDQTFAAGSQLAQWLHEPAVYGGTLGIVPVGVLREDFTAPVSPARRWFYTANGDQNIGGTGAGPGPNIPLQLTFDTPFNAPPAVGRVLFDDYHVESQVDANGYNGVQFPNECPGGATGAMTVPDKLFEFTMFNLTGFVGPPTASVAITNSPTTFTQGETADTLTIYVSNTGAAPLDTSLILAVALPTGITAVSMAGQNAGSGWSCDSGTLVCTRTAALNLAAIDPITLTVAVAPNASTSALTVYANATGGGLAAGVSGNDPLTIALSGCSSDSQCSAGNWCNESTRTCTPTLPNNSPLPIDSLHTNPTLNGHCTLGVGALVCTSGVCDTNNNKCGFATGDGACNQLNAAQVCDSGACSVSNVCEPAGGCEVNADCSSGNQCSAAKACIPVASVSAWPTASAINQGQTLAASTLTGGTASVSGTFAWTDPTTVPPVGTSSQSVTFSPTDTSDYAPVTGNISILVNGATTNLVVTTSADDTGNAANCTQQPFAGTGTDPSCSLRDALLFAARAGSGNISFDSTVFSTSNSVATNTITLNKGALNIPVNTGITFGPAIIKVATGFGPPIGSLAEAVDHVTLSTTVGQAHSVQIEGWVADALDGAPLSNVTVYIDGTSIGAPTLGFARPNVAATYNNNAYLNSGYLLLYPASSLVLGTHHVTVVAIDSGGRSTTFGPKTFTVATTAGLGSPIGALGEAVDSVTGSTAVSQSNSLKVQGWVADPQDGSPLSNVKVYVDGVSIGTPTLGIARADIATAYGSAYLHSGYRLLYPASSLALGTHQVTVVAVDSGGRTTTLGPRTITVQ